VAHEVVEGARGQGAAAAIRFYHEHLVAVLGIYVVIFHIRNGYFPLISVLFLLSKKRGKGEVPVLAPREPIAQPPDQLQKMFSTMILLAGLLTVSKY